MKKSLLIVGLILVALGLTGCVAVVSHKHEYPKGTKPSEVDPTIAEIDMVRELFSEPTKGSAYAAIAGRRGGLSPAARAHLIETVREDSFPQADKEKILLRLLKNPRRPCPKRGPCGKPEAKK